MIYYKKGELRGGRLIMMQYIRGDTWASDMNHDYIINGGNCGTGD